MRRLAGVPDDPEDILGRKVEDRQPVEDLTAGDAHALVVAPGNAPCAIAALVATQSKGVDEAAFEVLMCLQIAAQLALDGSSLMLARAEPLSYPRPPPSFLDAFEQGLSGCDGRKDKGHARRNRALDMLDRPGPLDLSERSVDGDELVVGNDTGNKQARLGCPFRPRR